MDLHVKTFQRSNLIFRPLIMKPFYECSKTKYIVALKSIKFGWNYWKSKTQTHQRTRWQAGRLSPQTWECPSLGIPQTRDLVSCSAHHRSHRPTAPGTAQTRGTAVRHAVWTGIREHNTDDELSGMEIVVIWKLEVTSVNPQNFCRSRIVLHSKWWHFLSLL